MYNKDRTVESKIYWRWEDRKCKGRIAVNGENLVKVSAHTTHGPCKFETVYKNRDVNKKKQCSNFRSNFRPFSTKLDHF